MRTVKVDIEKQRKVLTALHTLTFPGDDCPRWRTEGLAWITYDDGEPVAFLYAEPLAHEPESWYFSRVGVMPAARRRGLQRKLMRLMQKALKGHLIISTTYGNPASANNFVREQWMTYNPASLWGAPDTIYWRYDPR